MKKIIFGTTLALLLIGMLTFTLNIQLVKTSGTIFIRADGSIDPPTAPIHRDGNTYTFTDNISDSIVIERNNTILDGAGHTLQGSGSGHGLELIRTQNVTIKNTNIKNFGYGVYLGDSSNNTVSGNNITNNEEGGIVLRQSSNNTISGNNITWNSDGIRLRSPNNTVSGNNITYSPIHGIHIDTCNNNIISENNITDGEEDGVCLWSSDNNTISGNNIANNGQFGISLCGYSYNKIYGNTIAENGIGGIQIGGSDTAVYHNNFIDNEYQAFSGDALRNVWDDGYPSGGNYWSDHTGVDLYHGRYQNETGSDGIGDTPYIIDTDDIDNYPLMGLFGSQTMTGTNVTVFPTSDTGLTFDTVETEGSTIVSKTETGPIPPIGFKVEEQYYNITTTASYSGNITIRIIYDDSDMTLEEEENLQLLQWNETTQDWMDITTYIDTENNLIYGETTHLSKFSVTSPLIHDISITRISPQKTVIGQGYILDINVTISNIGDFVETSNITLYAATVVIGNMAFNNLQTGVSTTLTFSWNTNSFVKNNYTITAYIEPVPNETNIVNNNMTDGGVVVTISGDVDGDFDVDILDVTKICIVYGSRKGEPEYVLERDINCDGKIDILDVVIACIHYGEKDP